MHPLALTHLFSMFSFAKEELTISQRRTIYLLPYTKQAIMQYNLDLPIQPGYNSCSSHYIFSILGSLIFV